MSKYVGIDPSLRNTGITMLDEDANITATLCISSKLFGVDRLKEIYDSVELFFSQNEVNSSSILIMEGPSYNSISNSAHEIGELFGILQLYFVEKGLTYVCPTPLQLKKFFTGKARAEKSEMLDEAVNRYPNAGITELSEHEVDALSAALYGKELLDSFSNGSSTIDSISTLITDIQSYVSDPVAYSRKRKNLKLYFNSEYEALFGINRSMPMPKTKSKSKRKNSLSNKTPKNVANKKNKHKTAGNV